MQVSEIDTALNTIEEALEDLRNGKVIIVVDDEDRENEGDFICAAEIVTPEIINFMATHGRGLICAPIIEDRAEDLGLELMVSRNTALHETAFTVSIDLIGHGCSTGISAYDRATGIRALTSPDIKAGDYARPGHIFPLRAKNGGVLRRTGHTEAAIDLARMAGFYPAGVLVEILNEDGSMARLPQLMEIARKFDLKIISIANLVAYRLTREQLIIRELTTTADTAWGTVTLTAYAQITTGDVHLAIRYGHWASGASIPVRVQSARPYSDLHHMFHPEDHSLLSDVFSIFVEKGAGLLVLMYHRDKTPSLMEYLRTITDPGKPHNVMDQKDFGIGAQIIRDQGVSKLDIISDAPVKRIGLEGYGLEITGHIPLHRSSAQ